MKKAWLIAFNVVTLIAWMAFFVHAIANGLQANERGIIFLAIAQGLAIFEIMNSILGIAGANWLLTTMQVFSRFLIAGLLLWIPFDTILEIDATLPVTGFALISIAWSVTEIVRALFYLTDLLNTSIKTVVFARYTFFIFLYPIGVTGEFLVMYDFWKWREFAIDPLNIILAIIALSYFVFFPKLYGHMWKQRKKKLS
jgi:very-long-chain (3R)-3-hydroxyacyl-CoA dehydratase